MKQTLLLLALLSLSIPAKPGDKRNLSNHTGDLNGDGFMDLVVSIPYTPKGSYGKIKVFFGNKEGLNTKAGWAYICTISNFLENIYSVKTVSDINGDGTDELGVLLTSLSKEKSGRSTQSLYLFYGTKQGLDENPVILKLDENVYQKYSLRDFFPFDYNGDEFTDILAVSSKRNYRALEPGWKDTDTKLILYKGSAAGIDTQFETLKGTADNFIFKEAGDINNDGINDFVTGEYHDKYAVWTQYLGRKKQAAEEKPFLRNKLLPVFSSDRMWPNNNAWDINGDRYFDSYIMKEDRSPLLKKADSTLTGLEFYMGSENGLSDTSTYTWQIKTPAGISLNITACGDLNGDGYSDMLLQKFSTKEDKITEAWLLTGKQDGLHIDTTFNTFYHSLHSVSGGLSFINAIGDINKDGFNDLVIGLFSVVLGNKDGNFRSIELNFKD